MAEQLGNAILVMGIVAGRMKMPERALPEQTPHWPGDLLILPKGWKGEWTIHEHMRKLYIISA